MYSASIQKLLVLISLVVVAAAGVQLQNSDSSHEGCLAASSKTAGFPVDPTPRQLKLSGTDLCLDVKDGLNADGAKLQLWTCTPGNDNQLWSRNANTGAWQWVGTNKCIDLTGGLKTDGNPIQVWSCDPSGTNRNQLFSGKTVPDTEAVAVKLMSGNAVCE
ncbi:hypothetical protein PM082_024201 [Marasmius tenuissimus]|nr:hypothetical protein PM082_024201 [Marasmius tenuissimus]